MASPSGTATDTLPAPSDSSLLFDSTAHTPTPTSNPTSSTPPLDPAGASVVTVTYQIGPTTQPSSSGGGGSNIPIGAIVGGALGGMAIVALVVFAWIWWGRSIKRAEKERKRQSSSSHRTTKMPPRPSMKHVSSSTGSSFLTRDGKTVSFEIVSPGAAAVAGAAVPMLGKHVPPPARRTSSGPRLPPGAMAAAAGSAGAKVVVTPPEDDPANQPRVLSPERPEKSPYRPSKRREAALAVTHARTGSGGSYRPSPLSQGASYTAPSRDPSPGAGPRTAEMERVGSAQSVGSGNAVASGSGSGSVTASASGSETPSPTTSPPTPPFLRKTPTAPKSRTNASLAALHAAATTPTPNLSLLTQNDGRVNRLSAMSVQPPSLASPSEREARELEWAGEPMPAGARQNQVWQQQQHWAQQQQQQQQREQREQQLAWDQQQQQEADQVLWRGSRAEMTPSPEGPRGQDDHM
ncbi:hypothetical protein CALCODRAFT_494290 [Calocera cornea HHB12733]|uniref:Uncharacterized protein n=1 Tax=Calocera cornea HHB12733 TaxID=1353952 RepID=A0A165H9N3_9BASI|nr:hypothetical protein CALCODRAFT_494290 [Calocera cornea HHB12733]